MLSTLALLLEALEPASAPTVNSNTPVLLITGRQSSQPLT